MVKDSVTSDVVTLLFTRPDALTLPLKVQGAGT